MKTYHFLAGLPRSGNTLLSSILNQNPLIHSSPLSPINQIMWQQEQNLNNHETVKRLDDKTGFNKTGPRKIKLKNFKIIELPTKKILHNPKSGVKD